MRDNGGNEKLSSLFTGLSCRRRSGEFPVLTRRFGTEIRRGEFSTDAEADTDTEVSL